MSLEKIQRKLESIDGISLVTVEENPVGQKGVLLHIVLEEGYEGEGDDLYDEVLNTIPRDALPEDYDPDERVDVYYDAIEIQL